MATTTASGTDPLAAGRAALARAAWEEARAIFEAATAEGGSGEAWEGLSRAVWWQCDEEATLAARERAYLAYRDDGDARGAARMAMWLGSDHFDFHGDDAVAEAWLRRGRDLVDGLEPCEEHGWLWLVGCNIALLVRADTAAARAEAEKALELARQLGDVGLEMVALTMSGFALVMEGEIEEGVERLDRSVSLAVAKECSEVAATAWTFCHTVTAATGLGDFARAEQWCGAMHAWVTNWRARQFFGVCRTAYGEVLATRGDWPSAEQELAAAIEDLPASGPAAAAAAIRLGALRARQGDHEEARRLFQAALPMPHALLALATVDLEEGDAEAALDAAERVLRRVGDRSCLDRFPALELLARARAATGDAAGATAAADDVEREAARLGTTYMRGRGALVRAAVLAAGGDQDAARCAAEDAIDFFAAASAPYEQARARIMLSQALGALGRRDRAEAEANAAKDALAHLGAGVRENGLPPEELTVREVEILRLVSQGLSDADVAARLFLSPHTVHRHVANVRTKLRVPSRAAAVAHATRAGLL